MAKKIKIKKKITFKQFVFGFSSLATMLVFFPTTIFLLITMLPTFVAYLVDNSPEKNKTFTIGAMNFAGCFPYLVYLWSKDNSIKGAFDYLSEPRTIMIIYALAGVGYIINWAVSVAVSSLLVQKAKMRINKIEQEKQNLIKRWGETVNGKYTLDHHGFPVSEENEDQQSS